MCNTHAYTCTRIYTCIYTYICTHAHIYTHTQEWYWVLWDQSSHKPFLPNLSQIQGCGNGEETIWNHVLAPKSVTNARLEGECLCEWLLRISRNVQHTLALSD